MLLNTSFVINISMLSAYRRDFNETKHMSFLIKDNKLLEKHNEICEKVKNSIKNENINTYFHNNKIPKYGSQFICLSVILIDSVFITGKNYYPQVFLGEFKYVVKETQMPEYITDDIEISSDSDREDSDEKSSSEENYNEQIE